MKQSIRTIINAIARVVVNMEFDDFLVVLIVVLAILASGYAILVAVLQTAPVDCYYPNTESYF